MVRWREGRHLMPVPRVLEEEMLDLLSHLPRKPRISRQAQGAALTIDEPAEGIGTIPIHARAS